MPFYMNCPHCDHPQIIPAARRGRARFCRQCGHAYVTSKTVDLAEPLAVSSVADLIAQKKGTKVYILAA